MPPKKKQCLEDGSPVPLATTNAIENELLPYLALGFAPQETPGIGNFCGVFALAESLRAVRNLIEALEEANHYTAKDLLDIIRGRTFHQKVDDLMAEKMLDPNFVAVVGSQAVDLVEEIRSDFTQENFFTLDQLQFVMEIVNEELNTSYRLGVIRSSGVGEKMKYVDGLPVLKKQKAGKKGGKAPPPQNEMEKTIIAPSAQIHLEGAGPVVFIHHTNGAKQSRPTADHYQSFGPNPSTNGVEEALSWGLDPRVNAAVAGGLYLATEDIAEDIEDENLGALTGAFLYQIPYPTDRPAGKSVLQTTAEHIYARNCGSSGPQAPMDENASVQNTLHRGQVALDQVRKIEKVDPKPAEDLEPEAFVPLIMYKYVGTSGMLGLTTEIPKMIVRSQDATESVIYTNFLKKITTQPFLIRRIVKPLTEAQAKKEGNKRYPQKVAELREIVTARNLEAIGTKADLIALLISNDQDNDPKTKDLVLHRINKSAIPALPPKTLVYVTGRPDAAGFVTIVTLYGDSRTWPLANLTEERDAWGIRLPVDDEEVPEDGDPGTATGTSNTGAKSKADPSKKAGGSCYTAMGSGERRIVEWLDQERFEYLRDIAIQARMEHAENGERNAIVGYLLPRFNGHVDWTKSWKQALQRFLAWTVEKLESTAAGLSINTTVSGAAEKDKKAYLARRIMAARAISKTAPTANLAAAQGADNKIAQPEKKTTEKGGEIKDAATTQPFIDPNIIGNPDAPPIKRAIAGSAPAAKKPALKKTAATKGKAGVKKAAAKKAASKKAAPLKKPALKKAAAPKKAPKAAEVKKAAATKKETPAPGAAASGTTSKKGTGSKRGRDDDGEYKPSKRSKK